MKKLEFLLFISITICFQACKKNSSNSNYEDANNAYENYNSTYTNSNRSYGSDVEVLETYEDGTYCSDVDYYNPDTGTRSYYTLNIDVEDNEVTVIHFSSGWLDGSEFSSEELDNDGYCYIRLYDGRVFEIQITGPECSFDDGYRIQSDIQNDVVVHTCPNCGSSKNEYDNYCDDCQNRIDKTCSRCGDYDTFMWSGDELCSDCKRDDEREEDEYNY